MIKILIMMVVGLVLFAGSAGVSWMMAQKQADASQEETTDETGMVEGDAPTQPEPVASDAETVSPLDQPVMPSPAGISAETVLRLSDSIRQREKQLQIREERVARDEKRLKLMLDDIQRVRSEISAMMEDAELRGQDARNLLEQVQATAPEGSGNGNTDANGADAANSDAAESALPPELEKKNLKTVAEWLKEMPAEKAARSLQELCDDGKMEMAVKLLSFLEQRDAAKILAALQDSSLITRLAERYRTLGGNTLRQ